VKILLLLQKIILPPPSLFYKLSPLNKKKKIPMAEIHCLRVRPVRNTSHILPQLKCRKGLKTCKTADADPMCCQKFFKSNRAGNFKPILLWE